MPTQISLKFHKNIRQNPREPQTQPPQRCYIQSYTHRMKLRSPNFNNNHDISERGPRTAQIKSILKFISKLKSQNKNYEAILADMNGLNLTKYLQQISMLIAVQVNERDIRFFTQVATRLNRDYEDYPPMLLKDLLKQFALAYQSPQDNKSKLKSLLLFTAELFVCGFPFAYREISEMLKKLVKVGTKKRNCLHGERELRLFAYFYNCDIYAVFLRDFGTIFTSGQPRWMSEYVGNGGRIEQYPLMIPAKTRQDFTKIFFANYISSCCAVLEAAFERLKEMEEELWQNLRMSGQFAKATEAGYNDLKQKFIFTRQQLQVIICEISAEVAVKEYELVEVSDIMRRYVNKVDNVDIFQNEFERELYTQLPGLSKTQNKNAGEEEYKQFKQKLDACKNKNQSDEVVKCFEAINNKRTRKMLCKDIVQYRKQYQLVTPYLCRIAAVVGCGHKDLVDNVVEAVFGEYDKLRQISTTSFVVNDRRSRNLKYICQFTKFKVIQADRTLAVIQNLIQDLKGYNIQLLISVLESVGRFLYLSPQNANRFTFLLSKLENFMKQKSLPLFTTSQLANSINLLKPHVETHKAEVVQLSDVQKEARKIFMLDVIDDIDDIIAGVEKLVKREGGVEDVREELLIQIGRYDFLGSYHYAYLIRQLDVEGISGWIVAGVISKLQQAVGSGGYQNCLLWSRFLGQLYKYEVIKRGYLFQQLYRFMSLVKADLGVINLICTVLQTCHGYLDSRKTLGKNQRFMFLVQFKRYIHGCSYIPMLEQFKIVDVLEEMESNLAGIKLDVLESFLGVFGDKKGSKEVDLSRELDRYLEKYQLKEVKKEEEPKDLRKIQKEVEQEETASERNVELMASETDNFNLQFLNIMNSHIKDLTGKIAKPAFVEKVIERKKERNKAGEGEQKRTVIGRCGGKFVKKELVYKVNAEEKQKQEQDNKLL